MKKRVYGRRLGRERNSRRGLFRSLIRSLVEHGSIKTTKARAKAIQPFVDRLVKTAKDKKDASRRRVFSLLGNDKQSARGIFEMADKLFKGRDSGFTRTVPLGVRKGDGAEMVTLEFVEKIKKVEKKETKTKDKKTGKKRTSTNKKKDSKKRNIKKTK